MVLKNSKLRVVQTQSILFLKSERVGSDIGRILNSFLVNLEFEFQIRSISDPLISDIDFKNEIAWVWTTLNFEFSTP